MIQLKNVLSVSYTHLMDDTVKTPEDVEKYLQLSTLAVIPLNEGETDAKKKKKKVKRS